MCLSPSSEVTCLARLLRHLQKQAVADLFRTMGMFGDHVVSLRMLGDGSGQCSLPRGPLGIIGHREDQGLFIGLGRTGA